MTSVFSIFLILSLSIEAQPALTVDPKKPWEFACSTMHYDCSALEKPKVVAEPLFQQGYFGVFDPAYPDTVFIDSSMGPYLDRVLMESVLAHEYTHYIEYHLGLIDFYDKPSRCRTEWNGWRVGNAYVIVNGRPEFADYAWSERYGCYEW